jgi:hypothetical protein
MDGGFVRSADLWQTKMLQGVSNVCFGEAETQRLDIWPTAGLGRSTTDRSHFIM